MAVIPAPSRDLAEVAKYQARLCGDDLRCFQSIESIIVRRLPRARVEAPRRPYLM